MQPPRPLVPERPCICLCTKRRLKSYIVEEFAEWERIYLKSFALPETRSPIIRPKRPNTELKISTTNILTNLAFMSVKNFHVTQRRLSYKLGSAASANAALLPLIPTDTPHIKLHIPTVNPAQKRANPV
jgi:hypothetical protein